jgi:uncharacterized repeat protein (TIGR03833 family)
MASNAVPKMTQVIPGAAVSIVLKADQRTGRQVQGVVRDVLTRGDHHRGIKVRLADGRIGRVQRMDTTSSSSHTSWPNGLPASGSSMSSGGQTPLSSGVPALPPSVVRPRYRDVRLDEPDEAPAEQLDLGAYIVAPKRKGKGRKPPKSDQASDPSPEGQSAEQNPPADVSSATATCPVCGVFEGDEAAVAHHVAEHFE